MPNDKANLAISADSLHALFEKAVKESDLEESGKRYNNDLLFAPDGTRTFRDFTEFSDYFGE